MSKVKQLAGSVTSASRISFALVMLTISLLLFAEILGFTPQARIYEAGSRQKISESLTIQMSMFIPDKDISKIQKLIRLMVKRYPDILSAGIRASSGKLLFASPNHESLWDGYNESGSSTTHVFVPMLQDGKLWGSVELRFSELKGESIFDFHELPIIKLIAFVSLIGFVVFLLFILRTLRQLDPSSVIPDRVNNAFDTMAEGVIIVDEKEHILLANSAICEKIGRDLHELIGQKISELNWKIVSTKLFGNNYPWSQVIEKKKSNVGSNLIFMKNSQESIKFALNSSPILSESGKLQGVLITLDDISQLEQRNKDLKSIVSKLQQSQIQVQQQNKQLNYLATRDPLTDCLNRRAFNEQFKIQFEKARNNATQLSCIMVDIDHFKLVNDNYGHATGDEVIKMLADILKSSVRTDDLVGRYGGEEFCLVLPGTDVRVALQTAERIRLRIKDESARRYEFGPRVTVSLGVACTGDPTETAEQLNGLADEALYVAKNSGRNQVVRWVSSIGENSGNKKVQVPQSARQEVPMESVKHLNRRIEELEEIASSASAKLEYTQSYDALTGLPNHVLFYDRVYQAIEFGERYNHLSAVAVIDIEMFSHINNSLGRKVGDELLRQYSERLGAVLRNSDSITRISISRVANDEFAVLLTNLKNQTDITWIVKRLLEKGGEPFEIDGNTVHTSSRVGISLYPNDASNVEEMLSHAMTAKKYSKKHKSLENYQYYDTQMQVTSVKHLQLDQELYKAIENKQWQLLYQPKVDVKRGCIIGAEALLRWNHPERGVISPFEFMAFAEERRHIIPIGEWVIQQACKQLADLISLDITDFQIAINLSAVQLSDEGLVEVILKGLSRYNIPPRLLNIEITESAMMENFNSASKILARLHSRGITIAVDDFGTGYSSFGYLKTLPINSLKVDRSFIKDICKDPKDEQIVKTMISVAHGLNLRVVAEGVEDTEQLQLLNKYSCDEIQGYLFSRPIPSDELIRIIKRPDEIIQHLQSDSLVKKIVWGS